MERRPFGAVAPVHVLNKSTQPGRKKAPIVTEESARAQRAKLDRQATLREEQSEQDSPAHTAEQRKIARQELQAKRRSLETLVDSYIQDHIGGNCHLNQFFSCLKNIF